MTRSSPDPTYHAGNVQCGRDDGIIYAILMLGLFANGMGQSMLFTVLGPIAKEIGLAEVQVGLIIAASAATTAFVSPFWGRLADKYSRRVVFIFALTAYSLTSALFGFLLDLALVGILPTVATFTSLLACRIGYASLTAGMHPSAMAMTAEASSEKFRASRIALVGGAFSIGSVAGPVIGGLLTGISLAFPIYLGSALTLIASGLAWYLLREDTGKAKSLAAVSAAPTLRFYDNRIIYTFLSGVLFFICFSLIQQTVPFYLQKRFTLLAVAAAQNTGIAMTVLACLMVLAQLGFVSWIRWPPKILVTTGCLLAIVGLASLLCAGTMTAIFVGHGFIGFGLGLTYPALQTSASTAVGPGEQGAAAGIMGMAAALGYVIGPIVGTGLFAFSEHLPFVMAVAFFGICGTMFVYNSNPPKHHHEEL